MHLYFFLLVIVSLSCGSLPPAEIGLLRPSLATLGMVIAWGTLCHLSARVVSQYVKNDQLDPMVGAQWLEKQLELFRWLGLGVVVLCLGGFGLARTLDALPLFEQSMFLQSLVLLAPGLAITVATWSAEHRYGVSLEYAEAGIGNHVVSVWAAFRSGIAWLVVPVLLLFALVDIVSMLPLNQSLAGWLTLGLILLFVPLGLPWLIRYLFKTGPLNEPTEHWIRGLLTAAGVRRTKAVRWDTGGRAFNAMVAGFVPPLRTLLVSDRLMDELPREQVAMVVLHEAAHLRRRHVPLRMLAILPAWGVGVLVSKIAGDVSWALPLGSAVGILLTMLIVRIIAYRTEFDADVQACRIAEQISSQVEGVPDTYERASEALSAALMRVTFDHPAARKATWLHPGVAERVQCMRAAPHSSIASAGTIANPA